jgi:hypothetical protein
MTSGRNVRNFVYDPYTAAVFPELKISEDSNSMKRFMTPGAYYAVGRGAAITGRGAHLLLIDDPIKDMEEARSENVRRMLHDLVLERCIHPPAARGRRGDHPDTLAS